MSGERISLVPYAHSTMNSPSTSQQGPKLQLHLSQHRLADQIECWEVNCLNEQTEWQAKTLIIEFGHFIIHFPFIGPFIFAI